MSGFEKYKATDYQLYQMPAESLFYVVTAKDIVAARPCDLDDHISWLLDQKKYLSCDIYFSRELGVPSMRLLTHTRDTTRPCKRRRRTRRR